MSDELPQDLGWSDAQRDDGPPELPDLADFAFGTPDDLLAVLATAFAALAVVLFFHWRARRRERRIEAGNAALALLARQHDHFVGTKASFEAQEGATLAAHDPPAFNVEGLSFLFDARGIPIIMRLIEAQRRHARLASLVLRARDPVAAPALRQAIADALSADDGIYEDAFLHLHDELVRRFGERSIAPARGDFSR